MDESLHPLNSEHDLRITNNDRGINSTVEAAQMYALLLICTQHEIEKGLRKNRHVFRKKNRSKASQILTIP